MRRFLAIAVASWLWCWKRGRRDKTPRAAILKRPAFQHSIQGHGPSQAAATPGIFWPHAIPLLLNIRICQVPRRSVSFGLCRCCWIQRSWWNSVQEYVRYSPEWYELVDGRLSADPNFLSPHHHVWPDREWANKICGFVKYGVPACLSFSDMLFRRERFLVSRWRLVGVEVAT